MTRVFFSGSRRFTRLNQAIREQTDNIIVNGFTFLVGDANGADKSMQSYLAEKGYANVTVFCTGAACRNNIGHWEIRHVNPKAKTRKDFQYYALKDEKMCEEATYGFVMWDSRSKGTLNNIINLLEHNKKVLVYFSPSKVFRCLKTRQDLAALLANCDDETFEQLEKQLRIKKGANPKHKQLTFA